MNLFLFCLLVLIQLAPENINFNLFKTGLELSQGFVDKKNSLTNEPISNKVSIKHISPKAM